MICLLNSALIHTHVHLHHQQNVTMYFRIFTEAKCTIVILSIYFVSQVMAQQNKHLHETHFVIQDNEYGI